MAFDKTYFVVVGGGVGGVGVVGVAGDVTKD